MILFYLWGGGGGQKGRPWPHMQVQQYDVFFVRNVVAFLLKKFLLKISVCFYFGINKNKFWFYELKTLIRIYNLLEKTVITSEKDLQTV